MVPRPVRRSGVLDRELERRRRRPRRRRRGRLPDAADLGVRGGYRPPAALAGDLAKIIRYVALNLLFTTSPLYPVELPTAEPPRSINLDSNTYEGWPGVDASAPYIKPGLLVSELRELRWRNRLDYDNQDLPFDGEAERCYDLLLTDESCYPQTGLPGVRQPVPAEHPRARADQGRRRPGRLRAADLQLRAPATDDPAPLGFADDNYVDGTQATCSRSSPRRSSTPGTA